jgi:DNA-binding response OmpR family regulator
MSALIVEPNASASLHLAKLMSALGFESIWRARSIKQALRYCTVTPFDVAIIELVLGDQDGTHLIAALRAWPGSVDLLVAVCIDEERLRAASQARVPADAFLQKPLYAHALTRCIGDRSRSNRVSRFDANSTTVHIE